MERYEELATLGEGTYGLVLKCYDRKENKSVAIKILKNPKNDKNVKKNAVREIKLLRFVDHPNIVKLHQVFKDATDKNKVYLVLEYIERTILEELTSYAPGGIPDTDLLKSYAWQLFDSVNYLHCNGIMHRDIKPENILVSRKGAVKLCDFGFARTVRDPLDAKDSKYTAYVATRWYRAPELLLSSTDYSFGVDVWALGCVFSELLTSRPLFHGKTDIDLLHKVVAFLGVTRKYDPTRHSSSAILGTSPASASGTSSSTDSSFSDLATAVASTEIDASFTQTSTHVQEHLPLYRAIFSIIQKKSPSLSNDAIAIIAMCISYKDVYRVRVSDLMKQPYFAEWRTKKHLVPYSIHTITPVSPLPSSASSSTSTSSPSTQLSASPSRNMTSRLPLAEKDMYISLVPPPSTAITHGVLTPIKEAIPTIRAPTTFSVETPTLGSPSSEKGERTAATNQSAATEASLSMSVNEAPYSIIHTATKPTHLTEFPKYAEGEINTTLHLETPFTPISPGDTPSNPSPYFVGPDSYSPNSTLRFPSTPRQNQASLRPPSYMDVHSPFRKEDSPVQARRSPNSRFHVKQLDSPVISQVGVGSSNNNNNNTSAVGRSSMPSHGHSSSMDASALPRRIHHGASSSVGNTGAMMDLINKPPSETMMKTPSIESQSSLFLEHTNVTMDTSSSSDLQEMYSQHYNLNHHKNDNNINNNTNNNGMYQQHQVQVSNSSTLSSPLSPSPPMAQRPSVTQQQQQQQQQLLLQQQQQQLRQDQGRNHKLQYQFDIPQVIYDNGDIISPATIPEALNTNNNNGSNSSTTNAVMERFRISVPSNVTTFGDSFDYELGSGFQSDTQSQQQQQQQQLQQQQQQQLQQQRYPPIAVMEGGLHAYRGGVIPHLQSLHSHMHPEETSSNSSVNFGSSVETVVLDADDVHSPNLLKPKTALFTAPNPDPISSPQVFSQRKLPLNI